ncbi:MAG: DUF3088 family protein [Pseudomonadota bacterium]
MSERDTLYLLPPGFIDQGRREFCPECAEIWGLLAYYPALRESVDIVYEPIAHPRPALVARLGEGEWNCPTLILAPSSPQFENAPAEIANGLALFGSAQSIGRYYAERFGTAFPRGS